MKYNSKYRAPQMLCVYVYMCMCVYNILYGNNIVIGEGNGTPLQYSCLESPMDGGAWWAAFHGVAKSWTRLSDFTFPFMHWRRKW